MRLPAGVFVIPDAAGLALFTVAGCQIAVDAGVHWLAASLLGVVTGVFGGVLRDVLVNEVPLVMRPGTLYATAAWCGALVSARVQNYPGVRVEFYPEALAACHR